MDYKTKYLKYKTKYIELKKQIGGNKKIVIKGTILELVNRLVIDKNDDSINNLKNSIYSANFLIMSRFKGMCKPARTTDCRTIRTINFPFLASNNYYCASSYFIIHDKINNNLVIQFTEGEVLYCDHFVKELFVFFCDLYEQIHNELSKIMINHIHIVGHSMGASLANLFAYFIMIIENSTVGNLYMPSKSFFEIDYDLKLIYDLSLYDEIFNDFKKICNLDSDSLDYDKYKNELHYNKDTNLETIVETANILLRKGYPKINDKISICAYGAFPVFFYQQKHYDEYKCFYNGRIINFTNCIHHDEYRNIFEHKPTLFCDDKTFNITLVQNNRNIKTIMFYEYIDVMSYNLIKNEDIFVKQFILENNKIFPNSESKYFDIYNIKSKEMDDMNTELHNFISYYRTQKNNIDVEE